MHAWAMETVSTQDEELAFYAAPGPLTQLDGEPGLAGLPADIPGVARAVQGLLLHDAWASRYGVELSGERREEVQIRTASRMLARIRELDDRPLGEPRPPERRLVGNCRTFSVLTGALLRRAGLPARARCGFADYFEAGRFVDHWVVERWNERDGRWVQLDAQLDGFQRRALDLDFDPADVPADRFLSGGEAWLRCRSGAADPARFGIYEWWGAWFVRNNVVRDLAALSKVELLPWDHWGLMDRESPLGEGPADRLVDQVSALAAAGDWPGCRRLYEADDRLRGPALD
jgi:Transglutaminase-like superfamily